jgi:hypothetical protein
MGAFYAPCAGEGNQILQIKSFTSVDTIRGYTSGQGVRLSFAAQALLWRYEAIYLIEIVYYSRWAYG